jgi:hypothetical protein
VIHPDTDLRPVDLRVGMGGVATKGSDGLIGDAFAALMTADQPSWPLVREKAEVERSASGRSCVPSCREHFFEQDHQFAR